MGEVDSGRARGPEGADPLRPTGEETVVTIDGPAGAGKSTTAREVARRLGYRYLDSGALYRALTHALLAEGVPADRWPELDRDTLDRLAVEVVPGAGTLMLWHRGRRLTDELRTDRVNAHVSLVARLPVVREWLLGHQRALGALGRLVTDGRDMGTVVFPSAGTKVFLVADLEERARRRLTEQGSDGADDAELRRAASRLSERDEIDSTRETAPLRAASDAVVIDTTTLDFEEQVGRVVDLARKRRPSR